MLDILVLAVVADPWALAVDLYMAAVELSIPQVAHMALAVVPAADLGTAAAVVD
jgi:hypothetical protein